MVILEKITNKLIKHWGNNVGVDIIEQIKFFGKECQSFMSNNNPTPYEFKGTPDAPN